MKLKAKFMILFSSISFCCCPKWGSFFWNVELKLICNRANALTAHYTPISKSEMLLGVFSSQTHLPYCTSLQALSPSLQYATLHLCHNFWRHFWKSSLLLISLEVIAWGLSNFYDDLSLFVTKKWWETAQRYVASLRCDVRQDIPHFLN